MFLMWEIKWKSVLRLTIWLFYSDTNQYFSVVLALKFRLIEFSDINNKKTAQVKRNNSNSLNIFALKMICFLLLLFVKSELKMVCMSIHGILFHFMSLILIYRMYSKKRRADPLDPFRSLMVHSHKDCSREVCVSKKSAEHH